MDSFMEGFSDHRIGNTSFSKSFDAEFTDENDFSDAVFKYINDVLMEDDLEDKAFMIQDSTLHVAEKSFYDVLNNKYPPSPIQPLHHRHTRSSDASCSHSCKNCGNSFTNIASNLAETGMIGDLCKSCLYPTLPSSNGTVDGLESLVNPPLNSECSIQFKRGIEEIKKVLLGCDIGAFDFENRLINPELKEKVLEGKTKADKDEHDLPYSLLRGRKSFDQDESALEEGRSNKHLAIYTDESVIHEMFDKILLFKSEQDESELSFVDGDLPNEQSRDSHQNGHGKGPSGGMGCTKKRSKREAVDMRSLLIQCMHSVAINDHRKADKLMKQIRQRSSPSGDASQRLAHCFANGLEARLAGTGSLIYKDLVAKIKSTSDAFRAYQLYISAFPFMKIGNYFSTQKISELAENVTSVHVIHFGIMHGVQIPQLVQRLSTRPGGPPKLRITGIDFPQPGFRPAQTVEETGHRLANYCKRYNVPFEYAAIAQNWETIRPEDLKIKKDEVLAVNCLYQLHFLLDDTILENSPRDAVLNLIKSIKPDIFIHGVSNGAYNSPFFVSRFREALFYFSAQFEMFEACVPRENQERMKYETEVFGREVLNVIACEGLERVERPESYKQWQVRTLRAGFRQLPLNQEITKKVKAKVKSSYHKNFFVDESSQWMLLGWKGRVQFGLSCWKPA
ncbi:scarecrow-like protein 30 isoform X2 [Actinidia eriantha]|uniref:scarecrow-like protein 30 isoform X2 n=1 Tax=Actinidia eriantha TaxID=165200 RepID=UPI00258F8A7D|nr:scarecrow-like protein 30 isoform X2 [Actinidia eriantha]